MTASPYDIECRHAYKHPLRIFDMKSTLLLLQKTGKSDVGTHIYKVRASFSTVRTKNPFLHMVVLRKKNVNIFETDIISTVGNIKWCKKIFIKMADILSNDSHLSEKWTRKKIKIKNR